MASLARALRSLRKELDQTRQTKVEIPTKFDTMDQLNRCLNYLQNFYELLTRQKASFEKVQLPYLAHEWMSEADQKAANEQIDHDTALLSSVDKVLSTASNTIRRLTTLKQDEQERIRTEQMERNSTAISTAPTTTPAPQATTPTTQLPKIALPTFDGDIFKWQNFWDRFSVTVQDNRSLADVDKMSFLAGQITGDAAKAIAGLAITTANYPVAIKMLKERFGDNKAIIDSYYAALMAIQPAQRPRDLRAVTDQLDEHFNAIKALGEDVNHRHFSSLIRSEVPPIILVQMETKQQDENKEWDLDTWRDRLRKHMQICESAYHPPTQNESMHSPQLHKFATAAKPISPKKNRWQSTTSTLLGPSPNKQPFQQQRRPQNSPANHSRPLAQPTKQCPYCDRIGHFADQCTAIQTASARKEKLKQKRLCTNCLGPSHSIQDCRRFRPCYTCKKTKHHHSSICPDRYSDTRQSTTMMATNQISQSSAQNQLEAQATSGEHTLLTHNEISLLQTTKATFQQTIEAQGVFDNGSQRSYITEQLAKQLRIKLKLGGKLTVFTFASVPPKEINTKLAELKIQLPNGSIANFTANVIPHISGNIQRQPINTTKYTNILRDIPLADSIPVKPEKITIDFLIGADYMWEFINGEKISLSDGLHLISSVFGWLLAGRQTNPMDTDNAVLAAQSITSLYAGVNESDKSGIQFSNRTEQGKRSNDITFLWDMETLGIKDKSNDPSDEMAMQMFNDTVLYNDGRYFVRWPWKDPDIDLPSNYQLALGRLNSIIHRYQNEPEVFKMYHGVIEEQQRKGIIEKVHSPTMDSDRIHYIPHHGVISPEKTTKLRVVYNASAKLGENKSLNECLHRGLVMLDDVVAILVRFRINKIALATDIEKAFLQVGLQEDERNVTRFLWLQNPEIPTTKNNIQIYRFTRVPFGFISSPFLLAATIQTHLRNDGSETANKIIQNIYVDNIITGVDSPSEGSEFFNKTKTLFQQASMNVHEWMTNSTEVLGKIPVGDCAMGKYKYWVCRGISLKTVYRSLAQRKIVLQNQLNDRFYKRWHPFMIQWDWCALLFYKEN